MSDSFKTRLQRLEQARRLDRRFPPAHSCRMSVGDVSLVLDLFEPAARVLTAAERDRAERLLDDCSSGLSEAELDHQLALFV